MALLIFVGLLALAMIILAFVQVWVIWTSGDVLGYGAVQADQRGWPPEDERGAFVMLTPNHNAAYPGSLLELLATTDPGVVDTTAGAHFHSNEIKNLLIQSAVIGEPSDYRIYRLNEPAPTDLDYQRQPGGKVLLVGQKDGVWEPGTYIVDIPSEGMFGGRTYYQFYVDPDK